LEATLRTISDIYWIMWRNMVQLDRLQMALRRILFCMLDA